MEEKAEEKTFEKAVVLSHSNAKQFLEALTYALSIHGSGHYYNDKIVFHFFKERPEIRTLDATEISMVHLLFSSLTNYTNHLGRDIVIGIYAEELKQMISLGKESKEPLTFEVFTNEDVAKVKVTGEAFETELEGSLERVVPLPKFSFSNSFALTKKELNNVFKVNGNTMEIGYNEKGVVLMVNIEDKKYILYPKLITSDIAYGDAKVKVDIRRLKSLVRPLKSNQHLIFFYESYDKPIKILASLLDGTEINYYIAPIVENEE
ncbi:MAG: hypothetical protein ACPLZG_11305 [Thermoproteota archaeon]